MPEPEIHWYINTGTEESPVWTEVAADECLYFTGPDTTPTYRDPVIAPLSGGKIAEELWKGAIPYANGVQCTTYDGTVNQNRNVLRILFLNYPTATPPELTAYDDSAQAAVRGTPTIEMLVGTTVTGGTSFLKAIETTDGTPPAGWTSLTDDEHDLCGDTDKIVCSAIANAGESKLFNIVCYVPSDASAGVTGHEPVITIQYTYT